MCSSDLILGIHLWILSTVCSDSCCPHLCCEVGVIGPNVAQLSTFIACYCLPSQAVMAGVSAYSSALSSYLLPEHSFVQVLMHCIHALFMCDALCFLSLQWSLTGPLEVVEFCMQQALCCLLLWVHFLHTASHDYNRMLPQPFKQFHTTAPWCCSPSSALHCIMSHAMLIQTACGMYIHQADVSSTQHAFLDCSVPPEWSLSLETPCQTCLMHGGVSGCAGIFSVIPALLFPRSTCRPGNHIILHFCRTILAPHL